jgi:ribosome recycling factor
VEQFTDAFEQNKQLVSAVRQEQTQSIMQLAAKASIDRVKVIEEQLQRFTLYEDFKTLYAKVVPPIHDFQVAV